MLSGKVTFYLLWIQVRFTVFLTLSGVDKFPRIPGYGSLVYCTPLEDMSTVIKYTINELNVYYRLESGRQSQQTFTSESADSELEVLRRQLQEREQQLKAKEDELKEKEDRLSIMGRYAIYM